jgi:guanylate cyclase
VLAYTAILISVLAFWWVVMYWVLGAPWSAAIPLFYQVVSVVGLTYYSRTRDFGLFRRSQLLLMLVLPVALQWTLGGFVNSSAVIIWALFAPLAALLAQGPGAAGPWFVAYVTLIILSALADPLLAPVAPRLPGWFIVTNFLMNIGAVSLVVHVVLRYLAIKREEAVEALRREHQLLQEEQAKSEGLLLNVLPQPIAERLKRRPAAIADEFAEATVLFADIVDFTRISANLPPEDLVSWLNDLFSTFDLLSEQHGLEKIKTVGDAYMAVAGLPTPREDHTTAAAEMALAMRDVAAHRSAPNGEPLRMRIGLHSGPVVAGVIGTRKFIYDLWGDTVNTASRMESHGLAGAIQVTEAAYRRLRDTYDFEERGLVQVKGKGEMRTYLLIGRRAALVRHTGG